MLFSLLLVLSTVGAFAQDMIVKLSGQELSAKVTEVGENEIKFKYPNEDLTNTVSKNLVKEIRFASGRTQPISTRVEILMEEDWPKVQITTLENEVAGLAKIGEVRAKANGATVFSNAAKVDERATEKLKREAARLGAHIVLIQSKNVRGADYNYFGSTTARSVLTGVAYGYEKPAN
ncbi:hypothetical protein GCM10028805_61710 [Spirosoma harenae]